ncbi:MAG TPA: T9SS type A sorting domain-containing protein [Bacteroidia bacterium]|nr:T9SS type A sorting domain-containing protein [Bacteroidia bacterium]
MNKIYIKSILVALLLATSFVSRSQIINTFAGNGVNGYTGDGGAATAAELSGIVGVVADAAGNIYTAEYSNNIVRVINTSGIISTFAGNGHAGYSGDGGPATAAELHWPNSVGVDAAGNVYICDEQNNRIRKVNTSGIISTVAGNGDPSFAGDGGPATNAEFNDAQGIAVTASGVIYIADYLNSRIRVVNTSGIINTYAGIGVGGYSGDGGPATAAEMGTVGVGVDPTGNVYNVDFYGQRIRKINTSGIISTVAGNGYLAGGFSGDGGPATAAELNDPSGVTADAYGNVFIADGSNVRIRMVDNSGIISTFAGNGAGGFSGDGGPATAAELRQTNELAFDASGNFYIADQGNNRIRIITGITTGINEQVFARNEINIYPVPNTGIFTITGLLKGQIIELYNYTGQKLSAAISDKNTIQFDISNYANGIYLVRILNKDGSVFTTKKVVKME